MPPTADIMQPESSFRLRSAFFLAMHATPLLVIWAGFSWWGLALCVASYALRMFGVTAGYHRYFSHRSFRTSRVVQFVLAWLAQTSLQKGVLWWAAHHRHHHQASDQPDDVHSPRQSGFWYSHVGWVLSSRTEATDLAAVKDLARYPELVWLNRWHNLPGVLYAVTLYLIFGFHGLVWGFFVSTVLLWHATFTVNSLTHIFGRRVYPTEDDSRNNWLVAILTLGEGWHNNHHFYQRSTAQGWRWFEIDPTYWGLKILSWMRLVSSISRPPRHIVDRRLGVADSAGH